MFTWYSIVGADDRLATFSVQHGNVDGEAFAALGQPIIVDEHVLFFGFHVGHFDAAEEPLLARAFAIVRHAHFLQIANVLQLGDDRVDRRSLEPIVQLLHHYVAAGVFLAEKLERHVRVRTSALHVACVDGHGVRYFTPKARYARRGIVHVEPLHRQPIALFRAQPFVALYIVHSAVDCVNDFHIFNKPILLWPHSIMTQLPKSQTQHLFH